MAAAMKTCSLCTQNIVDNKSYRSLANPATKDKFRYAIEAIQIKFEGVVCKFCWGKLNRIEKLQFDISTNLQAKLAALEGEKKALIDSVGGQVQPVKTPTRGLKRSPAVWTPTGATPKSKRALFDVEVPVAVETQEKGTQTRTVTDDFEVKVTVKYAGGERSRIIRDHAEKSALKALENSKSPATILKNLSTNNAYKDGMLSVILKQLQGDVNSLCSKECHVFQGHASDSESLLTFDWKCTKTALEATAPCLFQILSSVVSSEKKLPILMTAASILLYGRSQRLCKLQYILGLIVHKSGLTKEGMSIIHDLGITVSPSSVQKKVKQLVGQQEKRLDETLTRYVTRVEKSRVESCSVAEEEATELTSPVESRSPDLDTQSSDCHPIEVLGDNVDVTVTPSQLSMANQRKSLHWFLLMVKQKRVVADDLNVPSCAASCEDTGVLDQPTAMWIPTTDQMDSLYKNFQFHIAHVLLKYIDFLKPAGKALPKYIQHEFMETTKKKSVFLNCDLIDASENSSQGMIEILEQVHRVAVPHMRDEPEKSVLEKVVFGGDVLTNERAFSAQEAMQNCASDFSSLRGVIHRPEGLHREMNYLLVKCSSISVQFLFQRSKFFQFKSHHHFIEDVTDAFLVGTFMDNHNMESMSSRPAVAPIFALMDDDAKARWVFDASEQVMQTLEVCQQDLLSTLREDMTLLDRDHARVELMKHDDTYECALCGKGYTRRTWFKKHLIQKHHWQFHEPSSSTEIQNPVKSFLMMSLLYRDTCNSYSMGDGDRIVRNAYCEWLYASSQKHTKYALWLWRMITYVLTLPPNDSFEYKWNMTVNLQGGMDKNIPNDNCVEIQVHKIKSQLQSQGANKSFESARTICMTTQVIDAMKEQLMSTTKTVRSRRTRPSVDKSKDIEVILQCLRKYGCVKDVRWDSLDKFRDPLQKLDASHLHEWILGQQKVASVFL